MLKYKLVKCGSLKKSEKLLNKYVREGWKLEKMVLPVSKQPYILVFSKQMDAQFKVAKNKNVAPPVEVKAAEDETPKTTIVESV